MLSRRNIIPSVTNGSNDVLFNLLQDNMLDMFDLFGNRKVKNRFKVMNKKDTYVIVGEVPGFTDEEVKVAINNGVLHISGKHQTTENDNYFSNETAAFEVMYTLPNDINTEAIDAVHRNGVLEISLPKYNTEIKLKEIPIKRLKE